MSAATPLTLGELTESLDAIGGFEARPLVAVAVSGGPDSMALAILADRWARRRGGEAWALTVDHRLRPESAAEAQIVADWLAGRAIPHEVLVWSDAKPASGIQEAARAARYRLLAAWCRERGCLHLLTAHHREDQAETHLIRRRAGSGIDGLAGMSAVREIPGLRLVRPLLGVPKARLAAVLAAERQRFLSDPSNQNPAFERSRLRQGRDAPDGAGLDRLSAELRDLGRQRIAREHALNALLANAVRIHPAGFAVLDPAALDIDETELAERLLGRVALCIGGAAYPLRRARLARLRAGLSDRPERARTLGGCRFVPWRGQLLVLRELAGAAPPVRIEPGTRAIWDRRFAIESPRTAAGGFTVGYLGQNGAIGRDRGLAGVVRGDLPRLVHPVLPAIWDDAGLVAVPHLGDRRGVVQDLPGVVFRPANPLSVAGFTVV
ncbi:MAG TPA: tRNA lysidine(34) synthetase TilS [Stellaceae bacterium]|nr:tRNA lysidine(34) synthetase TilS [Stellaceae bacterium]